MTLWSSMHEYNLTGFRPHCSYPAASRVLDAIIGGPTIPPQLHHFLPPAMEAQSADIIDDCVGARVGACFWAAADLYFKVCWPFLVVHGPK